MRKDLGGSLINDRDFAKETAQLTLSPDLSLRSFHLQRAHVFFCCLPCRNRCLWSFIGGEIYLIHLVCVYIDSDIKLGKVCCLFLTHKNKREKIFPPPQQDKYPNKISLPMLMQSQVYSWDSVFSKWCSNTAKEE